MKKILNKLWNFSGTWTGTLIIVLLIIFFIAQAFVIPSGSMKNTLLVGDHLFVKKFSYGIPTPHLPWIEIPVLPDFKKNGHLISANGPKRGDITVFRFPHQPKIHYVKRTFAIGGDEVIFSEKVMYLRPNEGDEFITKNYKPEQIVKIGGKNFIKEPYPYKGIHYDENENTFITLANYPNKSMEPKFFNELPSTPIIYKNKDGKAIYNSLGARFNAFYYKVPQGEYFMVGDNRDHSFDSRFWGSVEYRFVVGKPWFVYFSLNKNYEVRWERIGRFTSTLQDNDFYINQALKEEQIEGIY